MNTGTREQAENDVLKLVENFLGGHCMADVILPSGGYIAIYVGDHEMKAYVGEDRYDSKEITKLIAELEEARSYILNFNRLLHEHPKYAQYEEDNF